MDRTITVNDFPALSVFSTEDQFEITLTGKETAAGVHCYQLKVIAETATIPEPISLRWRLPSFNVKGVWKCGGVHDKRQRYDWELDHLQSRISVDAPIISVFGHDDTNVITFACSDAINLLDQNALLREEDNHLYCHLTFFSERHPAITEYEAEIRIDTRSISYAQAVQEVSEWWEGFPHLTPTSVPDLAKAPLYSTWYQFHQDLDEKLLLQECEIARTLGYELIILDDGWQTLDNNRGYDYTGDWEPDRFPDLADFVASVHRIGMKFGLWFSVPFCGPKSKAYRRFKGKFLTENHRWAPVFDPRYPEVRAYLIEIYTNALRNWNLDAFKLDFIDDFRVYPETVLTKENGRDYANVNAAVDRLLTDVTQALRAIKPEVAIEFRQRYIGPAMRKFGNMFRAFDCPNDAVSNRIRITDVKLLCGASAVHSDPLTWHCDEHVEIAALQMLNGMFGVPQMSVHLRDLPDDHLRMVRFYTQYWRDHAELLMDGRFEPVNPLGNYPLLRVSDQNREIIGVYDDIVVTIAAAGTSDLINAKRSDALTIRNPGPSRTVRMTSWDCRGEQQASRTLELANGVTELPVAASGLLRITSVIV